MIHKKKKQRLEYSSIKKVRDIKRWMKGFEKKHRVKFQIHIDFPAKKNKSEEIIINL